ncbi:hypothetical protein GC194_14225 [bacterium]|nr:hypothetical protein [bacterium]
MRVLILLFVCLLLAGGSPLLAQGLDAQKLDHTVHTGMYTLLGWSVLNLGTGLYGNCAFDGKRKYFSQMNAGWNLVNLGIATGSLLYFHSHPLMGLSAAEQLDRAESLTRTFLFNGGLDFGYMAAGAFLLERGKRLENSRLQGFGNALMLQGAFLCVFDLIMYMQVNEQYKLLKGAMLGLAPTPSGVGFVLKF